MYNIKWIKKMKCKKCNGWMEIDNEKLYQWPWICMCDDIYSQDNVRKIKQNEKDFSRADTNEMQKMRWLYVHRRMERMEVDVRPLRSYRPTGDG
jgi:hypothetical protein